MLASVPASSQPGFVEVLEETSSVSGYPPLRVEHDYWMVRGLFGISNNLPSDGWLLAGLTPKQIRQGAGPSERHRVARWAFAGGTSLTAAWGLVERFSEDVDANLFVADQDVAKNAVRQAVRTTMRWISEETGAERISQGNGAMRVSRFNIPGTHITFTADGVDHSPDPGGDRVEICRVDSIIGRAIPELLRSHPELGGFELPTVVPQFTAANKLDALHRRHANHNWEGLAYRVRDVLDLRSIADSRFAGKVRTQVPGLVDHMRKGFGPQAQRPDGGYGSSTLYDPHTRGYETLRVAYHENLPALMPSQSPLPDFDESMEKIRTLDLA